MIVKTKSNITIVIHTENQDKLKKLLKIAEEFRGKGYFCINLNAKGYIPWNDEEIKKSIISFDKYNANPTEKLKTDSIVELITKCDTEFILILDEDCSSIRLNTFDEKIINSLYGSKKELLRLNMDSKYQSVKWFIIDLLSQKKKTKIDFVDDSLDYIRYNKKIENPIFYDRIFK
jgi:hypothetical protein